jgi:hypothetical protein
MTALTFPAMANAVGNWIKAERFFNGDYAQSHQSPVKIRSINCLTVGTKPFE